VERLEERIDRRATIGSQRHTALAVVSTPDHCALPPLITKLA
jgi:hypothetical protein